MFKKLFNRKNHDISKFVHYKIIDETGSDSYVLQCVNSKTIITAHILEIIHDSYLLYGLHPLQSCFIGIEYAKQLKTHERSTYNKYVSSNKENNINCYGYGTFKIIYQDRKGNFAYVNVETEEQFLKDPATIVLNDKIIKKFNSEDAFHLGISAGLKIHKIPDNVIYLQTNKYQKAREINLE